MGLQSDYIAHFDDVKLLKNNDAKITKVTQLFLFCIIFNTKNRFVMFFIHFSFLL